MELSRILEAIDSKKIEAVRLCFTFKFVANPAEAQRDKIRQALESLQNAAFHVAKLEIHQNGKIENIFIRRKIVDGKKVLEIDDPKVVTI